MAAGQLSLTRRALLAGACAAPVAAAPSFPRKRESRFSAEDERRSGIHDRGPPAPSGGRCHPIIKSGMTVLRGPVRLGAIASRRRSWRRWRIRRTTSSTIVRSGGSMRR